VAREEVLPPPLQYPASKPYRSGRRCQRRESSTGTATDHDLTALHHHSSSTLGPPLRHHEGWYLFFLYLSLSPLLLDLVLRLVINAKLYPNDLLLMV
jgi:hypothetical protein